MIAEHWVFSYSFFLRLKQFLGKMGKGRLVQESKTRVLCDLCGSGSGEWKSGTHFQVASTARADFLTISFRVQRKHGYHQKKQRIQVRFGVPKLCATAASPKKNWVTGGKMGCPWHAGSWAARKQMRTFLAEAELELETSGPESTEFDRHNFPSKTKSNNQGCEHYLSRAVSAMKYTVPPKKDRKVILSLWGLLILDMF